MQESVNADKVIKQQGGVDADKLIQNLSNNYGKQISQLHIQVALLQTQNEELRAENQALQEQLSKGEPKK